MNLVLGQSHFIKTVEDLHEAMVNAVPGIKFGLAFNEASGACLVRSSGTDPALVDLAVKNALALGAGHAFVLLLGSGAYPVNVLNAVKATPRCVASLRHCQPGAGHRGANRPGKASPAWSMASRPWASKMPQALPGARGSCAPSATSYRGTETESVKLPVWTLGRLPAIGAILAPQEGEYCSLVMGAETSMISSQRRLHQPADR